MSVTKKQVTEKSKIKWREAVPRRVCGFAERSRSTTPSLVFCVFFVARARRHATAAFRPAGGCGRRGPYDNLGENRGNSKIIRVS